MVLVGLQQAASMNMSMNVRAAASQRHCYPRRPREYSAKQCEDIGPSGHPNDEDERLRVATLRMRAGCRDFRNTQFRGAVSAAAAGADGVIARSLRLAPPLRLRHVVRPGGAACAGHRHAAAELVIGPSAIDAALDLVERGICLRPALVIAAHPSDGSCISAEERELLERTNWATGFIDSDTANALRGGDGCGEPSLPLRGARGPPRLTAGSPECILAEQVLVLQQQGGPSTLAELAVAGFLPQHHPTLTHCGLGGYARRDDRLRYRHQVEAVLKTLCLLNVDAVCVGCAEGVAGAALFGHPLQDAAEAWREAIFERPVSCAGPAMSGQFKRVVFALAEGVPFSAVSTASVLADVFAGDLE